MVLPNEGPSFCLIENTTNLSISPSQDVLSEGHDYVTISCNGAWIGFGFFNVTNLAISSVVFHTCGGYPSSEVVKYVNETNQFLYYDSSVPMALFFSHCYNIKLLNITTSLDEYYAENWHLPHRFVVAVNLCGDSEITDLMPVDTSEEGLYNMMTMLLYFTDTAILPSTTLHCNLNITSNNIFMGISDPVLELNLNDRVRVGYFGDFILFLTQSFLVNVDVDINAPLSKVVFVNSDTASQVSFQGYNLRYKHFADSNGSEIRNFMLLYVLFYETSSFISNVTDILHPMRIHDTALNSIMIKKLTGKVSHAVTLNNVSLCCDSVDGFILAQNLAKPCQETVGELYLTLNNIQARYNFFYGHGTDIQTYMCLMCFSHIKQISMTGTNYFADNGGGTVINLVVSELAVSGNLTIMNGYAYQGGGISMDGLSTLAFEEPLVAGFYNNIGDQGSAINTYSPMIEQNDPGPVGEDLSTIQIRPNKKYSLSNVTSINISLYFWNNTDGLIQKSFYAPLFCNFGRQTSPNLLFNASTWDSDRSQFAYTTLIDTILHMDRMDKYTSLYNGVCIRLHGKDWECIYLDQIIEIPVVNLTFIPYSTLVYPGQKAFTAHILSNQVYNAESCDPHEFSYKPFKYFNTSINRDNSTITFTFQQPPPSDNFSDCYFVSLSNLEVDKFDPLPILQFNFSDCPPGFYLRNGNCVCDSKLVSHNYSCDINTEGFVSPPSYWTGLVGQSLLFDDHCHPNYCDSDKSDFHLTYDPTEACLGNRTGVLCGKCKENYSVVFGSDTCYDHCTDVYLLTIPAYALAGLLLVFLLFALRITVATGTINGLIFYANVLGLVLDQLTEDKVQNSNYVALVRVFISLLNLDLGFPLCFYKGMTTAGKVGFQFLFPVYLWSIVVMLILLSKYSIRLSELISKSSAQVLVTLLYLSISKLLSTVIVIFSSSTISVIEGPGNYTSRLVWYYDGHDYGSSTHTILLALAVAFTVLFLLPYGLLVTFSSLLLRFHIVNKFKPFIDAYGGPFKDKWRFWFGLRLWITILLFSLDGALQGTNTRVMFIVIIITVVSFILLQNVIRPFKNRFVGALDLSFMVNYCLLVSSAPSIFWWVYIFMTATAVLTTVLIVVGHIFALSETCRAKCVNMLPQERNVYQYHEVMQDDDEDIDLFAAAEDRVQDTY